MSDYLRFFFLLSAAWINRDQQHRMQISDYLTAEIRVYRELCKGYRLRFAHKQRRRLSLKAKALGRKTLDQFASLVTPDTPLRWFRSLAARKYDGTDARRRGRPRKLDSMADLVVEMASKNQTWGYTRIRGARLSRFPCMELLRMQRVSDSVCRYAPRAYRYAPCCLPHESTRSTHQRIVFRAQNLACVFPRQRFAAPLRGADA